MCDVVIYRRSLLFQEISWNIFLCFKVSAKKREKLRFGVSQKGNYSYNYCQPGWNGSCNVENAEETLKLANFSN